MYSRIRSGRGLLDPPNGHKHNIFEWNIGGEDLYQPTRGFRTKKEKNTVYENLSKICMGFSNYQGMVPPYRLVLH